uniref:Putative secreted peptide n=1 Tax=Anopheles braziliensis TaxID=58242 RepID=A0A2M3ZRH5_9DIPT
MCFLPTLVRLSSLSLSLAIYPISITMFHLIRERVGDRSRQCPNKNLYGAYPASDTPFLVTLVSSATFAPQFPICFSQFF